MTAEIHTLIIDASGAKTGAEQLAQAARTIGQSGEAVSATTRKITESLKGQEKFLDRLRARYDPLFAVTAKFGQEQARLQGIIQAGGAFSARAAAELEALRQNYRAAAAAIDPLAAKMEELRRQTLSQKLDISLNIDQGTAPDFEARSADIAAYAAKLDALQARFDPLFAAERRYQAELAEAASAYRLGALTAEQYAAAVARIEAELSPAAAAARRQAEAAAEQAAAVDRLAAQFAALEAQVSPGVAAQNRFEQATATVKQALDKGIISSERYRTAMAEVSAALSPAVQEAKRQEAALAEFQAKLAALAGQIDPAVAAQARYQQALDLVKQAHKAGVLDATVYGQAVDQVTRSLSPVSIATAKHAAELDHLRGELDAVYAAQRLYEQQVNTLSGGLARGTLSAEEHGRLLGIAEQRYNDVANAAKNGGRSIGQTTQAINQAGYQIADFAVQVAGGQSALLAMTQQGTQVIASFGKWGPALGAVVAIVGGVTYGISRMSESASAAGSELDRLGRVISGTQGALSALTSRALLAGKEGMRELARATPELSAGLGLAATALTVAFIPAVASATVKIIEMTAAMAANPIGAVAIGVTAAATALVVYRDELVTIGETTVRVGTVAVAAFDSMTRAASVTVGLIGAAAGSVADVWGGLQGSIRAAGAATAALVSGDLDAAAAAAGQVGAAMSGTLDSIAARGRVFSGDMSKAWDETAKKWGGDGLKKAPESLADSMSKVKVSIAETDGELVSFIKTLTSAGDASPVLQGIAAKMREITAAKLAAEAGKAFSNGLINMREYNELWRQIQRQADGYEIRKKAEADLTAEIQKQTEARTEAAGNEAEARKKSAEAIAAANDLIRQATEQRAGAEEAASQIIEALHERQAQAAAEAMSITTAEAEAEADAAGRIADINAALAESRDRLQDAYGDYAEATKKISEDLAKAEEAYTDAVKSSQAEVERAKEAHAEKMASIDAARLRAEEAYNDRLRSLQQDREDAYKSADERLRSVRRRAMSDAAAEADKAAEAAEHINAAQALLQQGKTAQAAAEAEKADQLAGNLKDVQESIALTEQVADLLKGIADQTYKTGSDQAENEKEAAKLAALQQEQAAERALAEVKAQASAAELAALTQVQEARAQAVKAQQEAVLKIQVAQAEALQSEQRAAQQTLAVQAALAAKKNEIAGQSKTMADQSAKAAEDNIKAQKEIAKAQEEANAALLAGDKNRADESAKAIENAAKRLSSEEELKKAVEASRDIIAKALETEAQKQRDLAKEQDEVAKKYGEQKAAADTLLQVLRDIGTEYGVIKQTAKDAALESVAAFVDSFEAVKNAHADMAINVAMVYDQLEGATKASAERIRGWLSSIAAIGAGGSMSVNVSLPGFATGGLVKAALVGAGAAFASGGLISGPGTGTSDSILAMVDGQRPILVSNGEGIITAEAVRHYGESIIPMINNKMLSFSAAAPPRFATGGIPSLPTQPVTVTLPPMQAPAAASGGDTYNITMSVSGVTDPAALLDSINAEAKRRRARGIA